MIPCCTNDPTELPGRMPFQGAHRFAQKNYGMPPDSNPIVNNPEPAGLAYAAAEYNRMASKKDDGKLGGVNPDVSPQPFYIPGSKINRAPLEASETGMVTSLPGINFGPDAFTYSAEDVRPRTQYAPVGESIVERWVLEAPSADTPCMCAPSYPYSLMELFLTGRNLVKVRAMFIQSGIFEATPELLSLNETNSCGCRILGGPDGDVYCQAAEFAGNFVTESVAMIANPVHKVEFLNTMFVSRAVASIKTGIILQARANYLRAEGNRAYLQDAPLNPTCITPLSHDLPTTLPGTGTNVYGSDTLYATRQLTAPISSVANRKVLSCLTRLPIGRNPYTIDPQDNCDPIPQTVQTCSANLQLRKLLNGVSIDSLVTF